MGKPRPVWAQEAGFCKGFKRLPHLVVKKSELTNGLCTLCYQALQKQNKPK
jgi:hypothetical protein